MKTKKFWSIFFQRFNLGDRVRVKESKTWIWEGVSGRVIKILKYKGHLYYLIKSDIPLKKRKSLPTYWENKDIEEIGYFRFEHLEIIEE